MENWYLRIFYIEFDPLQLSFDGFGKIPLYDYFGDFCQDLRKFFEVSKAHII